MSWNVWCIQLHLFFISEGYSLGTHLTDQAAILTSPYQAIGSISCLQISVSCHSDEPVNLCIATINGTSCRRLSNFASYTNVNVQLKEGSQNVQLKFATTNGFEATVSVKSVTLFDGLCQAESEECMLNFNMALKLHLLYNCILKANMAFLVWRLFGKVQELQCSAQICYIK